MSSGRHQPAEMRLFEGYGLQLEYAIVDADSLSPRPIADEVLAEVAGDFAPAVDRGPVIWSHKVAKHGIRVGLRAPAAELALAMEPVRKSTAELDEALHERGARLLGGGLHPWMDPGDAALWDRHGAEVYRQLHRLFDCRRHGWANVSGAHLSLPFAGDDEFAALHAAVRLALPLIPAIAASSPFVAGRPGTARDGRLVAYRDGVGRLASVGGSLIPEAASCRAEYEATTLEPIARDLERLDPERGLQPAWLNRRAAVANFERGAIDLRAADAQECPAADLAIAEAVCAVIRTLVEQTRLDRSRQSSWPTGRLESLIERTMADADAAVIDDRDFIDVFGFPERGRCRARDLWQHLLETDVGRHGSVGDETSAFFDLYVERGSLAHRLAEAFDRRVGTAGPGAAPEELYRELYRELADCLREQTLFQPAPAGSLLLPY